MKWRDPSAGPGAVSGPLRNAARAVGQPVHLPAFGPDHPGKCQVGGGHRSPCGSNSRWPFPVILASVRIAVILNVGRAAVTFTNAGEHGRSNFGITFDGLLSAWTASASRPKTRTSWSSTSAAFRTEGSPRRGATTA